MHNPPPEPQEEFDPVSTALEKVARRYDQSSRVSLGELMHALHERGFGLIMALLVLPNCVPIPIPPGGSTIFSIPLLFMSVQMLAGRPHPWIPKWLANKTLSRDFISGAVSKAAPRLRWLEKFLRPRIAFLSSKTGERIIGVVWLLFSISIAIPLPMTNFLPGVGILVMSLGLLSKDGYVIIIGVLIGVFGLFVTSLVLTIGTAAVLKLMPFLEGL
jgi:hypothetical protein